MKVTSWYKKRGLRFVLERAQRLNERYGLTSTKATQRIEHCVQSLAEYGCKPTFAVPGMIVERNLPFLRRLQEQGVEICVHGYNHVDLKACSAEDGSCQLVHAVDIFRAGGIEAHGFRCPYLSLKDDLIQALPQGMLEYSSNKAIQWPFGRSDGQSEGVLFDTIRGFYAPERSEAQLSIPYRQNGMLEIPVAVPDDLQMHDGLGYRLEEVSRVWLDILHGTYRRGELFNLMFHPELASFCEAPFLVVLQEAQKHRPGIWVARLRDVSEWWKEKSTYSVEVSPAGDGWFIYFHVTPRATILSQGFAPLAANVEWDGKYKRIMTLLLRVDGPDLPFVGLAPSAPDWVSSTMKGMGYIVESGESAARCSLYLDKEHLQGLQTPVDLVEYVECFTGPLVRFWPWPDGMRSALSVTGDMDALSLVDYAKRLFVK